ncbi:FtsX-like permease family protein [Microbispora siamensis]
MTTGIARASLRSRPAAFAGSFVALLFASIVVSGSTMLLATTTADGLSPAARARLEAGDIGGLAAVLLIGSVYMSIFVVASAMGMAVVQQQREFAMLRAIGARPWQIRRAVVLQAVAAAVPAAVLGFALGAVLGRFGFQGMVDHGLVPPEVPFTFSWTALPAALAVAVATSAVAGILASVRMARLRPAQAVAEAATPRSGLGPVRTVLGVLAVAGGSGLSLVAARQTPDQAVQSAFLVLILFCAGVGLLGPRIVGPAAALASVLLRPFGQAAQAAMLNVRSQTRRYSAAVVPVVLAVAFGTTKIAMHTTAEHVTGSPGSPGGVWMDYAGTALYTGFAVIAAANALAVISHGRRREIALLRLTSAGPGQVRGVAAWEAVLVALTSLIVGGVVAVATLVPILRGTLHTTLPYLPVSVAVSIAGAVLVLALAAIGLPVHFALRRRPTELIKVS